LDNKNNTQYGIDYMFKIIPNSLKTYKLMSIYAINKKEDKTIITALILIKFIEAESLKQLFSILRAIYNFSPICLTTDYDVSLQKALKIVNYL
jgi:hypothetical protein